MVASLRTIAYTALLITLGGCAHHTTRVYENTGERQCEGGGISLSESGAKLASAGIEVLDSRCGVRTGVAVMAVCGGPTVNIHTHEINARDFEAAQRLGFTGIDSLVNEGSGTGYAFRSCPNS